MIRPKTIFGLVLAALVFVGPALATCDAAAGKGAETRIIKLGVTVKGNRTRLIFDAEGAKPKQIGPASSDGISVFFSQMVAKIPDKPIQDRKAAAKEVKFRRESGFFEVIFREKNASVTSGVRAGKNGRYTLTLDVARGGKAGGAPTVEAAPDKNSSDSDKGKAAALDAGKVEAKVETSELFGGKALQLIKGGARPRNEEPKPAPAPPNRSFTEPDAKALALYTSANEMFESCSRNLVFCAQDVADAYGEAIAACPRCAQTPLAVYRIGLANAIMGNYSKADKCYKEVTTEWPENPAAARCWIGIGENYNRKQSYLEAMESFRTAQRVAVENIDKAASYCELGKVLLVLGANREALDMLNNCLGLVPDYYQKKPEILRYIGEANFGLGDAEKAKDNLLKYVNYQQSAPDQDIVLAKIAETFIIQGDTAAAKKMYAFVRKYYTDSEGDLICRVREGELVERTEQAIAIYNELCAKDLSPSLRRIVLLKLATLNLKINNPTRSLELLDEAFPARGDGTSLSDPSALREKVICELVRQSFEAKDYYNVIVVYDKYRRFFDSIQSQSTMEQVAESYAALKFYPQALSVYDGIFSKGRKKDEDLFLKCAVYALRYNDSGRAFQYCKLVQSDAEDLKKSEIFGHIFYRDQKIADALKSFSKVVQKGKDFDLVDPDSLAVYGYTCYQAKKLDEAIAALQKAAQRPKPEDPEVRRLVLTTLGKCFAEQKQYQKAAEMMEAARQFASADQANELLYETSKLYIAAGQMDKAVQELNQLKAAEQPFWTAVAQQQLNSIDMNLTNATP